MFINTELVETRNVLPMIWYVLNPSFEMYRIFPGPHQRLTSRRNVGNMAAEQLMMIGRALWLSVNRKGKGSPVHAFKVHLGVKRYKVTHS
jgi:hypothetical protein